MIVFITDPHIGTHRVANTTLQSRIKLKEKLFQTAYGALKRFHAPQNTLIIAGDVFDCDTNDERTILQGFRLARLCDVILAGNHDLPNREGQVSSLQLLDEMTGRDGTVILPPVGAVRIEQGQAKCGTFITLIPHHSTQELFDQAIEQALRNPVGGLVVTHCNFDSERAVHDDASLNITRKQVQKLLDSGYEYVLNGHEHKTSTHMGGRFVNLGNTHPTSMGDISDKFAWTYTAEDGLQREPLWSLDNYVRVDLNDETLESTCVNGEFIDLYGEISPEKGPVLAELVRSVFDSEDVLMVRNNVSYTTDVLVSQASEGGQIHDLSQQITDDLKNSDLADLWAQYREG